MAIWAICANVCEKLLIGRLTVLPNEKKNIFDQFEFQSQEKKLGPKKDFPQLGFWAVNLFWVKEVTNIQIAT